MNDYSARFQFNSPRPFLYPIYYLRIRSETVHHSLNFAPVLFFGARRGSLFHGSRYNSKEPGSKINLAATSPEVLNRDG